MRSKLLLLSVFIGIGFSVNSHAGIGKGTIHCIEETTNQKPIEIALTALISTVFAPTGTTVWVICVGINSAEINTYIIQKEATMFKEENGKIFNPSYLGRYAADKNISLDEAAEKVLNPDFNN